MRLAAPAADWLLVCQIPDAVTMECSCTAVVTFIITDLTAANRIISITPQPTPPC